MATKKENKDIQIMVRVRPYEFDLIEAFKDTLQEDLPGVRISRNDAVRVLLKEGLRARRLET